MLEFKLLVVICVCYYWIHLLWLGFEYIASRDAPLAPIVCRPTWVRCVAMRLPHLLCFGLYDTVAVSVGAVVERPLGHRYRNKISGAADEAIETVMNLRKLQLGVREVTGAAMKIWETATRRLP